jgi:hypothetical protein
MDDSPRPACPASTLPGAAPHRVMMRVGQEKIIPSVEPGFCGLCHDRNDETYMVSSADGKVIGCCVECIKGQGSPTMMKQLKAQSMTWGKDHQHELRIKAMNKRGLDAKTQR